MSSKIINIFCYITQCLILCGVQNFIVPLKNSTQGVFNTSDAAFVIIIKFIISFLSAKPYLISRNKFFARCQFIAPLSFSQITIKVSSVRSSIPWFYTYKRNSFSDPVTIDRTRAYQIQLSQ